MRPVMITQEERLIYIIEKQRILDSVLCPNDPRCPHDLIYHHETVCGLCDCGGFHEIFGSFTPSNPPE